MFHRPIHCVLVALALLVGTRAPAQAPESADEHIRNDCRLAAQIIRTGQPAPHSEWAYSIIRLCDLSGPAALAERWQTVADSAELVRLAGASAQFSNRTLFNALAAVVLDHAASVEARLQGMEVLASYANPNVALNAYDLRHPMPGRPPRIMSASGGVGNAGDLGPVCSEVVQILERTRDSSTVEAVQRIASEYIRFLQ